MTKRKALKELLKINLDELNDCLKSKLKIKFRIKFKGDEFTVLNKKGEIVLKDKLSNYDLDFESQKEFVFNIIKKLFIWIKRKDLDKDYFKNTIEIDNKYYSDILGEGIILKNNYIKMEFEDNLKPIDHMCYIKDDVEQIIIDIMENLDKNKIRVVLYSDDYGYEVGFYVDRIIHECILYIGYIKDIDILNDIKYIKDVFDIAEYDKFIVYYSFTTKEEIKKAVEFVKKLVKM